MKVRSVIRVSKSQQFFVRPLSHPNRGRFIVGAALAAISGSSPVDLRDDDHKMVLRLLRAEAESSVRVYPIVTVRRDLEPLKGIFFAHPRYP
jgi:hypothetical protein